MRINELIACQHPNKPSATTLTNMGEKVASASFFMGRLFLVSVFWVAAGCSTSQVEPGNYLTDTNSIGGNTDSGSDTGSEVDTASETGADTSVSCDDMVEPCHEGRCIDDNGTARCECNDGWSGNLCDECAAGWHEFGDDCVLDEQCLTTSCAFHEVEDGCTVEDGEVICECEGNWDSGNHCASCLPGYHEDDDECVEDLYCVSGPPCEHGGACSEQSGMIMCDCSTAGYASQGGDNWEGEFCEICPEGYHIDGDNCLENDVCTDDMCGDNGQCVVVESGTAVCICDTGWTHAVPNNETSECEQCAQGYHHPDGDDSACVEDDECETFSCGVGTCTENDEGGIDCECPDDTLLDPEFNCGKCLPAYHWVIGVGCVENDEDCDASDPCGDHGTCLYSEGEKSCDCDPMYSGANCDSCIDGYQDRDGNGVCAPNCVTAVANGLFCGDNGACDDASGVAICECDGQWAGAACDVCPAGNHLEGGDCVANQVCEPDSCSGHGACSVPSETGLVECDCDDGWIDSFDGIACAVCASGYQNLYYPDDCQPTCATAVAAGLECGDNGACAINTSTGAPHCACDTGYAGVDCTLCDSGFHLEGDLCVANDASCAVSDPCGDNGTCVYEGGVKSCECDPLYTGATCLECVTGYQDSNGDGECRPTCVTAEANGLDCGDNGNCTINVSSGLAECECSLGYGGADCASCASGYHLDGASCVVNEVCSDATGPCVNGACSVVGGLIQCACDPGYATDGDGYCTLCASGYHLNSGSCVIDEVCEAGVSCSGRGTCDDSTGVVVCTSCTGGFTTASLCANCPTGFHESGGVCVLTEACPVSPCNGNGTCDDSTGVAICSCDTGWTGDTCDSCAAGYHDDAGDCVLDETCIASSCSYHGTCDDSSGVVVCTCDDPDAYAQPYCATCSSGYHRDGATGDCLPNETCLAGDPSPSCNSHGTCDDSTGVIVCSCESEWTGDNCMSCAIGFHLELGACVADPTCSTPNELDLDPSCNNQGTCVDTSGSVVCTCNTGWDSDSNCSTCANGYHDENGDCVIDETCLAGDPSPSCNDQGSCDDSSGEIACACSAGFAGDTCNLCDTGGGYTACAGDCCSADETCFDDECVVPLTCDDIPEVDFTECGATAFDDGAGGTIDCGDCGANGTCVGGVCDCDDNYGVFDGEHECTYACDGYLPSVGCCEGDFVAYCSGGSLVQVYCGYYAAPANTCGWQGDPSNYFTCADGTPPVEYTSTCPDNIVVDTDIPACEDDDMEENDDEASATRINVGESVSATKCSGDSDFYIVSLTTGQDVTIRLDFVHTTVDLDFILWYDHVDEATYDTYLTEEYKSTPSSSFEEFAFTVGVLNTWGGDPTATGDYIIEVFDLPGDQGGYVLSVSVD